MFDDLITQQSPPADRINYCNGATEQHLSEGAVMVAFAMHLLRTVKDLESVSIHPDGEHGRRFDFRGWLESHRFSMNAPMGRTNYGGTYSSATGKIMVINPSSGRGDVVANVNGTIACVAECKGGIVNTRHPGQLSRLRKGLCEAVGLLLASEAVQGRRQFAVVPRTPQTESLAAKLLPRATAAGIKIALVDARGNVFDVSKIRKH